MDEAKIVDTHDINLAKSKMSSLVSDVKRIRAELKNYLFGQDNAINIFATGYFQARIEFCGSDKVYKNGKVGNVTSFVVANHKCVLLFD